MKVQLSNLGAIKHAEFTLGDLTVICGKNNTGKTYATYALYGFLHSWRKSVSLEISKETIASLLDKGMINIDLLDYIDGIGETLKEGCRTYSQQLERIFASSKDKFLTSSFSVSLHSSDIEKRISNLHYERRVRSGKDEKILLIKEKDRLQLTVTLLTEKNNIHLPHHLVSDIISETIAEIIFAMSFPKPFIASAERTGAAIFKKELNFARNRLLKEMSQTDKNINPIELFFKSYQDYALPVEQDVEFIRQLESLRKEESYVQQQHPKILHHFSDIIGGQYEVTKDEELFFKPNKSQVKLSMEESSSAVRSLLGIGFYLKHAAQKGDILMVDEPELNLHPENQRKIARLFASLINIGIKVFITTHSDYIVKELSTLIMLNHDDEHLKNIVKTEKYHEYELIHADNIQVYIAKEAMVKPAGYKRSIKAQTLVSAKVDSRLGIKAPSFDETIEDMNRIQDDILWGS